MPSKMNKKQFWGRLFLYILFGLGIPFTFMMWRFKLFQKVSTVSIGGWGLFAIIFVSIFLVKLMKSVKNGLPFSLLTQCLEGICKIIIPLIVAAFCVFYLQDLMTEVFQLLCVLIICEMFAIVANPIPQWTHENKVEESNSNIKELLNSLGIIKQEKK